jgi:hypothetical protein
MPTFATKDRKTELGAEIHVQRCQQPSNDAGGLSDKSALFPQKESKLLISFEVYQAGKIGRTSDITSYMKSYVGGPNATNTSTSRSCYLNTRVVLNDVHQSTPTFSPWKMVINSMTRNPMKTLITVMWNQ